MSCKKFFSRNYIVSYSETVCSCDILYSLFNELAGILTLSKRIYYQTAQLRITNVNF